LTGLVVRKACKRWRAEVTSGLVGRVVEIGSGSGLNVEHYPPEVEMVLAVEPVKLARRLAARRVGAGSVPVRHIGLDGQAIALANASCDAALSTFTLCTVADPDRVLAELRRVLRSGGRFHFLEHGIAPEPSVANLQRRIEPWQRRLADGCHLTRDSLALVGQAGFVVERYEQGYAAGPKPWSYFTVGIAVNHPRWRCLQLVHHRPWWYPGGYVLSCYLSRMWPDDLGAELSSWLVTL